MGLDVRELPDPASENDMAVGGHVLAYILDEGGSQFEQTITLPNVECAKCTLQVIQAMTDKLPWGPGGGNDMYYWCADIAIVGDAPGDAGGGADVSGDAFETTAPTEVVDEEPLLDGSPSPDKPAVREASEESGGCSAISVGRTMNSFGLLLLLLAVALSWRRRRLVSTGNPGNTG